MVPTPNPTPLCRNINLHVHLMNMYRWYEYSWCSTFTLSWERYMKEVADAFFFAAEVTEVQRASFLPRECRVIFSLPAGVPEHLFRSSEGSTQWPQLGIPVIDIPVQLSCSVWHYFKLHTSINEYITRTCMAWRQPDVIDIRWRHRYTLTQTLIARVDDRFLVADSRSPLQ